MLPLCESLHINVNELLSGQRLTDSDYKQKAEENMMNLVKEKEESKKKIVLSVVVVFLTILSGITLILLSGTFEMEPWLRVLLVVIASIVIAGGIAVAVALDLSSGTFECPQCGTRFEPSATAYIAGPHTITKRKLKCPNCGKISYCKKRLTH